MKKQRMEWLRICPHGGKNLPRLRCRGFTGLSLSSLFAVTIVLLCLNLPASAQASPVTAPPAPAQGISQSGLLPVYGIDLQLDPSWVDATQFPSQSAGYTAGVGPTLQQLWSVLQPSGYTVLRFRVNINNAQPTANQVANLCAWAKNSGIKLVPVLSLSDPGEVIPGNLPDNASQWVSTLIQVIKAGSGGSLDLYSQILTFQVEDEINHPGLHGSMPGSAASSLALAAAKKIRQAEQQGLQGTAVASTPLAVSVSFDYELIKAHAIAGMALSDAAYGQAYNSLHGYLADFANAAAVDLIDVDWFAGSESAGSVDRLSTLMQSLVADIPGKQLVLTTGFSQGFHSAAEQQQYIALALSNLANFRSSAGAQTPFAGIFFREAINQGDSNPPPPTAATPTDMAQWDWSAKSDALLQMWTGKSQSPEMDWWWKKVQSNMGLVTLQTSSTGAATPLPSPAQQGLNAIGTSVAQLPVTQDAAAANSPGSASPATVSNSAPGVTPPALPSATPTDATNNPYGASNAMVTNAPGQPAAGAPSQWTQIMNQVIQVVGQVVASKMGTPGGSSNLSAGSNSMANSYSGGAPGNPSGGGFNSDSSLPSNSSANQPTPAAGSGADATNLAPAVNGATSPAMATTPDSSSVAANTGISTPSNQPGSPALVSPSNSSLPTGVSGNQLTSTADGTVNPTNSGPAIDPASAGPGTQGGTLPSPALVTTPTNPGIATNSGNSAPSNQPPSSSPTVRTLGAKNATSMPPGQVARSLVPAGAATTAVSSTPSAMPANANSTPSGATTRGIGGSMTSAVYPAPATPATAFPGSAVVPNLSVGNADVRFYPTPPIAGQILTFVVTVHNQQTFAISGAKLRYTLNMNGQASARGESAVNIGPNGTSTAIWQTRAPASGSLILNVSQGVMGAPEKLLTSFNLGAVQSSSASTITAPFAANNMAARSIATSNYLSSQTGFPTASQAQSPMATGIAPGQSVVTVLRIQANPVVPKAGQTVTFQIMLQNRSQSPAGVTVSGILSTDGNLLQRRNFVANIAPLQTYTVVWPTTTPVGQRLRLDVVLNQPYQSIAASPVTAVFSIQR